MSSHFPFFRNYTPDDVVSWCNGEPISVSRFLQDVLYHSQRLPDKPYVLNFCRNRFFFLVGLGAALLRGQVSLLPPARTPRVLQQISPEFHNVYGIGDEDSGPSDVKEWYKLEARSPSTTPAAPALSFSYDQLAVVAFTSGSTGPPRPNRKTWGSLVEIARKTGEALGLNQTAMGTVIATVPPQHMYGLETSIMLPIQHGGKIWSGRPFFPDDIKSALQQVCGGTGLVTTPIHLRACLEGTLTLPKIDFLISATSPLPLSMARKAETRFRTRIIEIYGFAEAGSVAVRRPLESELWNVLPGVEIRESPDGHVVAASYLQESPLVPDLITLKSPTEFFFHRRSHELVKVAGHRVALAHLNEQLVAIEGVRDGVFLVPDDTNEYQTRLMALVVAPGKNRDDILSALREKIDPVFLPRPLYFVEALPRNETGKLPHSALLRLAEQLQSENEPM